MNKRQQLSLTCYFTVRERNPPQVETATIPAVTFRLPESPLLQEEIVRVVTPCFCCQTCFRETPWDSVVCQFPGCRSERFVMLCGSLPLSQVVKHILAFLK